MQPLEGRLLFLLLLFHACTASERALPGEDEAIGDMSSASGAMPSTCSLEDRALIQSSRHTSLKTGETDESNAEAPISFFQMVVENNEESCAWTVYHGVSLQGVEANVYEGEECLPACCQDPRCVGVAHISRGTSACHRFVHVPAGLSGQHGRSVGDGTWLQQAPAMWSIFMKGSPRASHVTPALPSAPTPLPTIGALQECQWEVHYDKWIKSFDGASNGRAGEYEHPGPHGGAHCLVECCRDPTCTALELLSSEKFQCYKYSSLPRELKGVSGTSLGDGEWLKHKSTKWSIFVKVGGLDGAAKAPPVKVMATPWDFSLLAQCLGVLVVLGGFLHLLMTEHLRCRLAAQLGWAPTKPECTSLIETVRLDKT